MNSSSDCAIDASSYGRAAMTCYESVCSVGHNEEDGDEIFFTFVVLGGISHKSMSTSFVLFATLHVLNYIAKSIKHNLSFLRIFHMPFKL